MAPGEHRPRLPSCLLPSPLWPRYEELAESVEEYVLDVLRDQLNRRQPIDSVSRNLLRLLTSTCGYKEVRLMAVQKLEMWLQNPKVRRGARAWGPSAPEAAGLTASPAPAADAARPGPAHVRVHELLHARR